MPLYEFACERSACPRHMEVHEEFFHSRDKVQPPICISCANPMQRLASRFAMPFVGVISASKYDVKGAEPSKQDGHTVWAKRTKSGNPEPRRITTFSEQAAFCKSEGLVNPRELPTNAEVSADGKKLSSAGLPGQWY